MSRNIIVTGLSSNCSDDDLRIIFDKSGPVRSSTISKDVISGEVTGFIEYKRKQHARKAAIKFNKTIINNCNVRVYLIWTTKEKLSSIIIRNIPCNTTTKELKQIFMVFGDIVDIRTAPISTTAFISFAKIECAIRAEKEMNGSKIGFGDALSVQMMDNNGRNVAFRNSFEYKRAAIPMISDYINHKDAVKQDTSFGAQHGGIQMEKSNIYNESNYKNPRKSVVNPSNNSASRMAPISYSYASMTNTSNGQYRSYAVDPNYAPSTNINDKSNDITSYHGQNALLGPTLNLTNVPTNYIMIQQNPCVAGFNLNVLASQVMRMQSNIERLLGIHNNNQMMDI